MAVALVASFDMIEVDVMVEPSVVDWDMLRDVLLEEYLVELMGVMMGH
jgi:hypothetical protein